MLKESGDQEEPAARGWRAAVPHLLAIFLILAAFRTLYTVGTRYSFAQGVEYWLFLPGDSAPIVVIAIAAWLAYRRSNRIRALPLSTGPWSLILPSFVAGAGCFGWAVYTQALDLQVVALALVMTGVVVAYFGLPGLRALWLPLFVLLFAVPLPAPLMLAVVFKLQIWTAQLAGMALSVLGIPHLVSGDQILRVSEAFQVIEGCSGMRSVQILTLLTILLIDLFERRGRHAALLLVIAPILAFALNGVRVVTLILNPHSEVIAIHNLQGIVILLVGLVTVYAIDTLLERLRVFQYEPATVVPEARRFAAMGSLGAAGTLAVVLQALALGLPTWQSSAPDPTSLHSLVGDALDRWASEKIPPDFSFRGSARFGEVVNREYHLDTGPVSVFVAESDFDQRGGSPLSPVTALPGSGWKVVEDAVVPAANGQLVDVRVVEKGKRRLLVHHWVRGAGGLPTESLRSFLALDRSPLRRSRPILVVRLTTPVLDRRPAAREVAARRLEEVEHYLDSALAAAARSNTPPTGEGTFP